MIRGSTKSPMGINVLKAGRQKTGPGKKSVPIAPSTIHCPLLFCAVFVPHDTLAMFGKLFVFFSFLQVGHFIVSGLFGHF